MPQPYRTKSGDLADKEGNPIRARRGKRLAAINELPASLTADQVLKAVSGFAIGVLHFNKEQLAALFKLGEAHRLWGAKSRGVEASLPSRRHRGVELVEDKEASPEGDME